MRPGAIGTAGAVLFGLGLSAGVLAVVGQVGPSWFVVAGPALAAAGAVLIIAWCFSSDAPPPSAPRPKARPPGAAKRDAQDIRWLEARARGVHYPHPDPARGEAYERLERALAELSAPSPPEVWQRAILDEIKRRDARWWARAWRWLQRAVGL